MRCARMRPVRAATTLLLHAVTVLWVFRSAALRCWDAACLKNSCDVTRFVSLHSPDQESHFAATLVLCCMISFADFALVT